MNAAPLPEDRRAAQRAKIRELRSVGMPTREIAAAVGLNKNQVSGIINRMRDIPRLPSPITHNGRPRSDGAAQAIEREIELPSMPKCRVPLLNEGRTDELLKPPPPDVQEGTRSTRGCRFPLWPHNADRKHQRFGLFCGRPVHALNQPYCATHHALCHNSGRV